MMRFDQILEYSELLAVLNQFRFDLPPLDDEKVKGVIAHKLYKYGKIIVCRENDNVLGFIAYYDNDLVKAEAYITLIAVTAEKRNAHIGYALLCEMEKSIPREMKRIRLEVRNDNESAKAFYCRNGFAYLEASGNESSYWVKDLA